MLVALGHLAEEQEHVHGTLRRVVDHFGVLDDGQQGSRQRVEDTLTGKHAAKVGFRSGRL
jgi:hypothetical protein